MISLAGKRVIAGRIDWPRIGAWVADLEVDHDDATAFDGPLVLMVGSGLALQGAAVSAGVFAGRARVRVVGGAGGLSKQITGKDYRNAPARIPVADALTEAGETLSPKSDADKLGQFLASWTRPVGTVGEALASLAQSLDVGWRTLSDGTVWLGRETWPAAQGIKDALLIEDDAQTGRLLFSADAPAVAPGTVAFGRKLSRVIYHIHPSRIVLEGWEDRAANGDAGDALVGALSRLVTRLTHRTDFTALYPARVITQHGDGSLDVRPDGERMPAKARVPLRLGIPGVAIKVAPGARVLLGFEAADPARPIATLWEADGLMEITVTASVQANVNAPMVVLNDGVRPIARQGDQVVVMSSPPGLPAYGTIVSGNPTTVA